MRVCLLRYLKGGVFALGLFIFQLIAVNYIYPWTMSNEALVYRENGYRAQNIGDIDSAITWYQKACELDSNYAIPHNDLGILYEAKGRGTQLLTEKKAGEYLNILGPLGKGFDYKLKDAKIAIVVMNSTAGTTKTAIDTMRKEGKKAVAAAAG